MQTGFLNDGGSALGTAINPLYFNLIGNSFLNINSAATTVVKSGAGVLKKIIINKGVVSSTITIYDNTAGSGTKIGTITFGLALLTDLASPVFDCIFSTGLTIVTSGAVDITVVYN